jgi:hypothetical protein
LNQFFATVASLKPFRNRSVTVLKPFRNRFRNRSATVGFTGSPTRRLSGVGGYPISDDQKRAILGHSVGYCEQNHNSMEVKNGSSSSWKSTL